MNWITIVLIVLLLYWWNSRKKKPYESAALQNVSSARVTLILSTGKRVRQAVGLDAAGGGKMPGTGKPCRIFMIDTEYLEKWAREQHHTSLSGVDSSSLRLNGGEGPLNMSQFTWTCQYEPGRSVIWVFIR